MPGIVSGLKATNGNPEKLLKIVLKLKVTHSFLKRAEELCKVLLRFLGESQE